MLLPVAEGLSVRSAIPGRIRWHAPVLRNRRALAKEIQSVLGADARVLRVEANPNNGTVLVVYALQPDGDERPVARELARRLEQLVRDSPLPPPGDAPSR